MEGAPVILSEQDVRGMVRLLGKVAALPGGHPEKKRYLMEGLCAMVEADCWVWMLSRVIPEENTDVSISFLHGGFSEERMAKYLMALEHPYMAKLNALVLEQMALHSAPITRVLQQILPFEEFYACPAYPAWEAADIGPLLVSLRPLTRNSLSTIGLYRKANAKAFTARDARITHIIMAEVGWLHDQGWPDDRGASVPSLHPRQRFALSLLLQGWGRKRIAAHMRITENTLAGYVRYLYRHFGVKSHAELMRRFYHGDGGDLRR